MATLKEISEQANWIHERSKDVWALAVPSTELEKMDNTGWKFDSGIGFFKREDKFNYRVTSVTNHSLVLIKSENGYGAKRATVPAIDDKDIFNCAGSEMVELTFEEILNTLQSLNLAIALHQDGDNQWCEDLI